MTRRLRRARPDIGSAMRAFATGVAIVACGRGAERAGCVATAVASLSLAPPSLIVNLQRDGSTYRRLSEGGAFSVNFLKRGAGAAGATLRRRGAAGERFVEGAWSRARPARRRWRMRWRRSNAGSRRSWSATPTPSSSAASRRPGPATGRRCCIFADGLTGSKQDFRKVDAGFRTKILLNQRL